MSDSLFAAFMSSLVGGLLLAWFFAPTSAKSKLVGDRRVLTYGLMPKGLAVVFLIGLPILGVTNYLQGRSSVLLSVVTFAGALVAGIGLGLEFFRARVEFDSRQVNLYSPWRRQRSIPWVAFLEQKNRPGKPGYLFTTSGYGSVRISPLLQGHKEFLEYFNRMHSGS